MRVLLVEDDPSLAGVLVDLLGEEGQSVTHAATAARALELAQAEPWDVCLVDDHCMPLSRRPDPGALSFLHSLTAVAPVVLCAASSWAMDLEPSELGIAAIVPMPFELDDLLHTVESAGSG
jgi:two-component system, OmpR family, response regulator QseB